MKRHVRFWFVLALGLLVTAAPEPIAAKKRRGQKARRVLPPVGSTCTITRNISARTKLSRKRGRTVKVKRDTSLVVLKHLKKWSRVQSPQGTLFIRKKKLKKLCRVNPTPPAASLEPAKEKVAPPAPPPILPEAPAEVTPPTPAETLPPPDLAPKEVPAPTLTPTLKPAPTLAPKPAPTPAPKPRALRDSEPQALQFLTPLPPQKPGPRPAPTNPQSRGMLDLGAPSVKGDLPPRRTDYTPYDTSAEPPELEDASGAQILGWSVMAAGLAGFGITGALSQIADGKNNEAAALENDVGNDPAYAEKIAQKWEQYDEAIIKAMAAGGTSATITCFGIALILRAISTPTSEAPQQSNAASSLRDLTLQVSPRYLGISGSF